MGAGKMTVAITDAGPLVHLNEISCLVLLRIFDTLHIPDAVWSETVGQKRVFECDVLDLSIVRRHNLLPTKVAQFTRENGLDDLHDGERECLFLCQRLDVSILLTDDLAVREQSRRLNLTPVGSLGVVVRAFHQGQISLSDAERHIANLYDVSSLFVTQAIVELAIEQLHKQPRP